MAEKSLNKLVKLMARLRSRNGCPWDRAQTHASLKKHLIEEAYEVCAAIDSKDPEKLKDELGDFLFQVIFHAQLAKEKGRFDIKDVLNASYDKMFRRHPHVFGKHKAKNSDDAYKRWQEKKDLENNRGKDKTLLRNIPETLPALLKAQKVSKRASWLGFDWTGKKEILKKINEELKEIKRALKGKNKNHAAEEIGDILFAIVNLARFSDIDAEEALNKATKKFTRRFRKMELSLEKTGRKIKSCGPNELTRLWESNK